MDIQRILEENQRAIEGEKRAEFERFRSLLLNYNEKYNLTAITEEKDVFYKHFLDSSAGSGVFKRGASVARSVRARVSLVVLKLLREDLSFTLLESVGKKCEFLRAVVDNLGLKGMNILNIRAEDAAREEDTGKSSIIPWRAPWPE